MKPGKIPYIRYTVYHRNCITTLVDLSTGRVTDPDFKRESFKSSSEISVRLGEVSFSERKLSKASLNAVTCKKLLLIRITNLHTSFDLIIELKKEL